MREQMGPTMQEEPGIRFGNYDLIKRIDVGGMGEVYLAHQLTAFGRPVAVKIIRPDLVHDITARARFLREAEVSAYLKHEHILALYDFGEVDGRLFLVTPYIEGGTLAKRLKDSGSMSLVDAHQLFVPLVQAIAYIHRRGVVHRDLKPTNIMLDTEDGEIYVRLIDFGIASLQGQSASPPLTVAGHEMGTIAYMAPERLSGIAAPSNDIFSLGVILHQMLTGRVPTAVSEASRSKLPDPLMKFVRLCIAANPADRYATAEDLLRAFEQVYQQIMQPGQTGGLLTAFGASQPLMNSVPLNQVNQVNQASRSQELVSLAHSGEIFTPPDPPMPPAGAVSFTREDYSAPTSTLRQSQQFQPAPTSRPPLIKPSQKANQQPKKQKNSLLLTLGSTMVLILLIIGAMLYYGYQTVTATSVAVNFSPQQRIVSKVFTIEANPQASEVSLSQSTIPEQIFTDSETGQQTGETTGLVHCLFGVFSCRQGVSVDDVSNLAAQVQPGVQTKINQSLQAKIDGVQGTPVSQVEFSNPLITPNPAVGTASQTVTVAVSEQGSVGYFLKQSATSLAKQLVTQAVAQLGPAYQLLASTITVGQPKLESVNTDTGVSTISIAGGAVARYQFTQSQLQAINQKLVGKTVVAAQTFLQQAQGIDPASVTIRFISGSGKAMPTSVQNIKINLAGSESVPGVPLTPVPGHTS
jgi:serine/threonine protein kinase